MAKGQTTKAQSRQAVSRDATTVPKQPTDGAPLSEWALYHGKLGELPGAYKVTVLKVGSGKSATKTFGRDGSAYFKTHDFDAGMWFSHEEHAASNIHDLSWLLTDVEAAQDSFNIRGELNVDAPSKERVRRMKNPDKNGNIWFIERPRHWLLIDIDDIEQANHFVNTKDFLVTV